VTLSKRKQTGKGTQSRGSQDPGLLTVAQTAELLSVPAETIRKHIREGAPTASRGRINLVHYAAWLLWQVDQRSRERLEPGPADMPKITPTEAGAGVKETRA